MLAAKFVQSVTVKREKCPFNKRVNVSETESLCHLHLLPCLHLIPERV